MVPILKGHLSALLKMPPLPTSPKAPFSSEFLQNACLQRSWAPGSRYLELLLHTLHPQEAELRALQSLDSHTPPSELAFSEDLVD